MNKTDLKNGADGGTYKSKKAKWLGVLPNSYTKRDAR